MYLGEDTPAADAAAADVTADPSGWEIARDWLYNQVGNVTYVSESGVCVKVVDGTLVVDRSGSCGQPATVPAAAAAAPASNDLYSAIRRVPWQVWAGVGGLALFILARR